MISDEEIEINKRVVVLRSHQTLRADERRLVQLWEILREERRKNIFLRGRIDTFEIGNKTWKRFREWVK